MQQIVDLSEKNITLQRNEVLKRPDTIDTNIYYVAAGSLSISVMQGEEEQIIRFGYKDNLIVALDSFLTGRPSEFCIRALKKSSLKIISQSSFEQFLQKDTRNKEMWIKILEELVLQQMERERDLLISSPSERYHRVLTRSPQLFQEIPHRYIANYLRMSPETLSRLKKS